MLEAVAVTVTIVVPASEPELELTERLTLGKSLSVRVMFWEVALPKTRPDEGLVRVNMAVSVPSIKSSLMTVKVTVPVVCPFKKVIVLLLRS